jgi:WD40 repeat protein
VLVVPGNEQRQQRDKQDRGSSGGFVLARPEDRTAYLRDVESGEDVALFKGHEGNITAAQFNADGSELVTAGEDGTVRVWNCRDNLGYGTVLSGHSSAIARAAFSPNGRYVMTTYALSLHQEIMGAAGGERSVRLWNSETGTPLHVLKEDLRLPSDGVLGLVLRLFYLGHTGDIPWNTVLQDQILGAVRHAEFSRDGSRLLTVSEDSPVRRFGDASAKQHQSSGNEFPGDLVDKLACGVNVRFSPVRVWDVGSGKKLVSLTGFNEGVRSASLSPDGRWIVTVRDSVYKYVFVDTKDQDRGGGSRSPSTRDAAVRIWHADSGEQAAVVVGPASCAFGAAWSPDGKLLFTATSDLKSYAIRYELWDTRAFSRNCEFKSTGATSNQFIGQAEFSPDSRHLMLLRTDNDIRLVTIWKNDPGNKRVELRHPARVNNAAFSPDRKRVVTAADDGTGRVWNVETGEPVFVLRGHNNAVHSASFSPDGQWIITASEDTTARVWYADTGREYFTLSGHLGPVFEAAFSPDSQRVITASGDGTARIWPVDSLSVAISRKPRDLTMRERELFQVGPR